MIDDSYSLFHQFTNMLMEGPMFQESQQELQRAVLPE